MNRYRKKLLIAKQLCSIVLLTSFVAASARAQTPATATANDDPGDTTCAPLFVSRFTLSFVPSGFQRIIKEFDMAWRASGDGTNGREGVLLIFRMEDGSYTGKSLDYTNEHKKFTFKWRPNALAIVHTHPNVSDPEPSAQDQRVAEKFDVPIFTITIKGMYVYDPAAKITSKVMDGLDWLNLSRWTQEKARNVHSSLHQVHESGYLCGKQCQ